MAWQRFFKKSNPHLQRFKIIRYNNRKGNYQLCFKHTDFIFPYGKMKCAIMIYLFFSLEKMKIFIQYNDNN